jgi:hypothetical protein
MAEVLPLQLMTLYQELVDTHLSRTPSGGPTGAPLRYGRNSTVPASHLRVAARQSKHLDQSDVSWLSRPRPLADWFYRL